MIRALLLILGLAAQPVLADPDPADWEAVEAEARGQTVYWNAWGGSTQTNAFIAWIGEKVAERHGVTVVHVKLADTADAVSRVLAERAAGTDEGGAVDLIWINGENFATMKRAELLFGPFAAELPNWELVDASDPLITRDFTVPTDGFSSPWAKAQVVFMHDTADMPEPLTDLRNLTGWASRNPGRFTYPQPPDFLGVTFLKQALYALAPDPAVLSRPTDEADYEAVTEPLWTWLDALTPHLWRAGRAYPQSGPAQIPLLADGEIDLAMSLSPGEASAAIEAFQLPPTVRTFVPAGGTIGNASFVAIPYNASAKAGAMVVANLLLSPEAQARALDPAELGYGTVLDMDALLPADRSRFDEIDLGIATLTPEARGTVLPEPHPSWSERLKADWAARYGTGD